MALPLVVVRRHALTGALERGAAEFSGANRRLMRASAPTGWNSPRQDRSCAQLADCACAQ